MSSPAVKAAEQKLLATAHQTNALVSSTTAQTHAVNKRVAKLHTSLHPGAAQPTGDSSSTTTTIAPLTSDQMIAATYAEVMAQKALLGRLQYTVAQELQKLQTQHTEAVNNNAAASENIDNKIMWISELLNVLDQNTSSKASKSKTSSVLSAFGRGKKSASSTSTSSAANSSATVADASAAAPAPASSDAVVATEVAPISSVAASSDATPDLLTS